MAPSDSDDRAALLLEAIYLKYHYDFRSYAAASLKRRLAAALRQFGCPSLSDLQERGAARAGGLPRASLLPHRPGERDVPRPRLLPRAAREGRARPADLSVAQGLGRRLQHGRGGLLARHPAARGRACRSARSSTRPTSTREALRKAEAGVYAIDRIRVQRGLPGRGRARVSVGLLHGRLRRRRVRQVAAKDVRVLGPQPRDRQRLRRGPARVCAATCSSTSTASCRTARSGCSATRCAARAFSASARRRRCASPPMHQRSEPFAGDERIYRLR